MKIYIYNIVCTSIGFRNNIFIGYEIRNQLDCLALFQHTFMMIKYRDTVYFLLLWKIAPLKIGTVNPIVIIILISQNFAIFI